MCVLASPTLPVCLIELDLADIEALRELADTDFASPQNCVKM